MEEQEVLRLFGLFTGLSEEEAAGWAVLCRSTIAELTGRLRPLKAGEGPLYCHGEGEGYAAGTAG